MNYTLEGGPRSKCERAHAHMNKHTLHDHTYTNICARAYSRAPVIILTHNNKVLDAANSAGGSGVCMCEHIVYVCAYLHAFSYVCMHDCMLIVQICK